MNQSTLHEIIQRFEKQLESFLGGQPDGLRVWRAQKTWREEWLRTEGDFDTFALRYNAARKNFGRLLDSGQKQPGSGLVMMWRRSPQRIEQLFREVLLGENCPDTETLQKSMDHFLDAHEELRQTFFPKNRAYQMDWYSASVFRAFTFPDRDFICLRKEAVKLAGCIQFDVPVGSGRSFSLPQYYLLCEEIARAMQTHDALVEKYFNILDSAQCEDHNLHLLAVNLMICAKQIPLYEGFLKAPEAEKPVPVQRVVKKSSASAGKPRRSRPEPDPETLQRREERRKKREEESRLREEERQRKEAERLQAEARLQAARAEMENALAACREIKLEGTPVTMPKYGQGTIIRQDLNKIRVRFDQTEKTFVLDTRYTVRPKFAGDDEIVAKFSLYERAKEKTAQLEKKVIFV